MPKRGFSDVYVFAQRYSAAVLVEHAAQLDAGFDENILATMIRSLRRFDDDDIPVPPDSVAELRHFFGAWQARLPAEPGDPI